ncbi:MAG: hypothetical protein AAFV43_09235 [Planctomycetota bacterium]
MRQFAQAAATATLALLATLAPANDPNADADGDWIRIRKTDDGKPAALQTSVGSYQGRTEAGEPLVVDLVGAVHVGDRRYYRELNARFRDYDVVLYELVAPEGTRVARGQRVGNDSPLGAMQNGMKSMLGLEHQLEWVDYTPRNFVHADMSAEQLFASMGDRGEGFMEMYFRLMGQSIAEQTKQTAAGESPEFDLIMALFSGDRERQLRIAMAKQMASLEGVLSDFGGPRGSTIIHERNAIALRVLANEIDRGQRRIAVFYGAGHLEDMDERLRQDFGMRQTGKEWIDAWRLDR